MLNVILQSFLITILFTPYGLFLSNENRKNLDYFSSQLLYGLIILSFIGLFLNFFFPLNKYLNTLILIIPIIFLLKKKSIYFTKQFFLFSSISALIIFILICESDVYRPDAGLYHLPYIKILNEEKIIFGLSNLHFRYAHISIIQYLSAVSNNIIFSQNGIVFAQALVASSIMINFLSKIYRYNRNQKYNFHFFFLISASIYIAYKMNRYSEYGNDAPSHFIFFFLISELLNLDKTKIENVVNNFILIAFIIFNKITLLLCVLFSFILLKNIKLKKILKLKRTYFIFLFVISWLLKNIIISGCLLYPVKSLCNSSLFWTDIKTVRSVSIENEVWTKGWPDYTRSMINNESQRISKESYLKNFFWISYWSKNHLIKILNILLPYIIFMVILSLILFKIKKKKIKHKINKTFLTLIILMFFSTLFWFLKVPVFRYGYSYIISLICFLFAYFAIQFKFKKNIKNLFNIIIIFIITTLITKNFLRIVNSNNDYNNYPWPKYYSMDNTNQLTEFKKNVLNDKIILNPTNGYCMYSEKICTNYELDKKLKLKNINSYNFFYKNKYDN